MVKGSHPSGDFFKGEDSIFRRGKLNTEREGGEVISIFSEQKDGSIGEGLRLQGRFCLSGDKTKAEEIPDHKNFKRVWRRRVRVH